MGLTREQFDTISNNYNNRRLENKIEMDRRIKEVYENVPQIAEYDREIASLAVNATRLALSGDASAKDSLREDKACSTSYEQISRGLSG